MSFRVGDPIFNHLGQPGIVSGVDAKTKQVKVDTKHSEIQEQFRHGYLKGLSGEARDELYQFLDEVKSMDNPKSKILAIQKQINLMEEETSPKSQVMIGYLKAELYHVMSSNHYSPRHYEISAAKAP